MWLIKLAIICPTLCTQPFVALCRRQSDNDELPALAACHRAGVFRSLSTPRECLRSDIIPQSAHVVCLPPFPRLPCGVPSSPRSALVEDVRELTTSHNQARFPQCMAGRCGSILTFPMIACVVIGQGPTPACQASLTRCYVCSPPSLRPP